MAALFTKPGKKLKEMNPEEYDKARFIKTYFKKNIPSSIFRGLLF